MKKGCYLTSGEDTAYLTVNSGNHKPAEKNWFRRAVKAGMMILTVYKVVIISFIPTEFVILTSITIYEDFPTVQFQLIEITEIYSQLWENDNFIVRGFLEK